jgi:hypothetical protein
MPGVKSNSWKVTYHCLECEEAHMSHEGAIHHAEEHSHKILQDAA